MQGLSQRTIDHSELAPLPDGHPSRVEWDTYRREVARLLTEGREGKHVLIKGDEIIGIHDTHREAMDEGYRRFQLTGFLVQEIRTRERVLRVSSRYS